MQAGRWDVLNPATEFNRFQYVASTFSMNKHHSEETSWEGITVQNLKLFVCYKDPSEISSFDIK